jgi:hypothetical protein
MPVMFVDQRGRTLQNDDLTVADLDARCSYEYPGFITGYEWPNGNVEFHVAVSYIVEWWETTGSLKK